MHKSARPSVTESDAASVALRIMSEREADHSDDYAALLDCLVRSVGGLDGRARVRVQLEVNAPTADLETAT